MMFQFQTGSIKRIQIDSVFLSGQVKFQFQTGSIKSHQYNTLRAVYLCFNSKLVRLKVALST